jgi:hypothetical protein
MDTPRSSRKARSLCPTSTEIASLPTISIAPPKIQIMQTIP